MCGNEEGDNHNTHQKKLLLHSCCGPCSTAVLERVCDEYDVTLFFYNPNVTDVEEYQKRKEAQLHFLYEYKKEHPGNQLTFLEGEYDPECFYEAAKGLEDEPEGGRRCTQCFRLRLGKAAEMAKKLKIPYFDTTLSVSPHKDYKLLCQIAGAFEEEGVLEFLAQNYKKKAGFQRSVQMSKEYGLYRQNYCGCEFSKWE